MLLRLYVTLSLLLAVSSAQTSPDVLHQVLKAVADMNTNVNLMRSDMKTISTKMESMSTNMGDLNLRVARIENRRMTCDLQVTQWFGKLNSKLDQTTAKLETKLDMVQTQQTAATDDIRFNFRILHAEVKATSMTSGIEARMYNATSIIKTHLNSSMQQLQQELTQVVGVKLNEVKRQIESACTVPCNTSTTTSAVLSTTVTSTPSIHSTTNTSTVPFTVPSTSTTANTVSTTVKGFEECSDVYSAGQTSAGSYIIKAYASRKVTVWCDQGWTTIQRRKYGDVSFDRDWADYVSGFGDVSRDVWVGLEAMHSLTRDQKHRLRVEFFLKDGYKQQHDGDGKMKRIDLELFSVGAGTSYRLNVRGTTTTLVEFASDASYLETYHNGASFSTRDKDQDTFSRSCASNYATGWWYNNCYYANYNLDLSSNHLSRANAKSVEMKIRR